jgi:hypothetical protein
MDDPDSPFTLSFDLNTHTPGFYVPVASEFEKDWYLTDHDISMTQMNTQPVMLNQNHRYVFDNMIKDGPEDSLNENSKIPSGYLFVDNEVVFNYWRDQLIEN